MKKKILIICGGLLTVVVVAAGIFQYYVKPKYLAPLVMAVEEFLLEEEETVELLIQEYEKTLLEDEDLKDQVEQITEEVADLQDISGTDETIDQMEDLDKQTIEAEPEELKESKKESKKKLNKKIVAGGKTMEELQAEVAPSDLRAGLNIVSKIDTGYLLGLSKGGLTPEKKSKAYSHLTSRLSSGEYSQLKGLVGKYSYLLR